MDSSSFELVPFIRHLGDVAAPAFEVSIAGRLQFSRHRLQIDYVVSGIHLSRILWPSPASKPKRRDNLWQHSCFEVFIAGRHHSDYYEFNFSPSGHWALYHFQSYRAYKTEPYLDENNIDIDFKSSPDRVLCSVKLNLNQDLQLLPADVGVTSVIETQQGLHYFALSHVESQPDFHQRRSFILLVE